MDLSIIIINYNTNELTIKCISSIYQYTKNIDFEIIVVDNASPDQSPREIVKTFSSVKLIENNENTGFAKGNNLGINNSRGEFILLLNSDTYQTYDCIGNIYKIISKNEKIGIISPQLKFPDGKNQWTSGHFPSIWNEVINITGLNKLNQKISQTNNSEQKVEMLTGAFMMFKRESLNHFKGSKLFDEFFMYNEDLVWSYDFLKTGKINILSHNDFLYHINGGSNFKSKSKLQTDNGFFHYHIDNEIRFIKKEYSTSRYTIILVLRYLRFRILTLLKPNNQYLQNLHEYYKTIAWRIS